MNNYDDHIPDWSDEQLQEALDHYGPKADDMGITLNMEDAREILTNLYLFGKCMMDLMKKHDLGRDPEFIEKCEKDDKEKKERKARYDRDFGTKILNEKGEGATYTFCPLNIDYLSRQEENFYTTSGELDIEGGFTAHVGFNADTSTDLLRIIKSKLIDHYRKEVELRIEKPFVKRVYTPWFHTIEINVEAKLGYKRKFVNGQTFYPFIATKVYEINLGLEGTANIQTKPAIITDQRKNTSPYLQNK